MKNTNRAFTLIELLVVIAIIAILAAILFPVFAQAKLAAKKTVALSNAKNTALALQLYSNDFDDSIIKAYFGAPAGCAWGSITPDNWYTWRVGIQPYAKNIEMLGDSTNQFSTKAYWQNQVAPFGNPAPAAQLMPTNFALNDAISGVANGQCIGTHDSVLESMTSIESPASTIFAVPSNGRTPTIQFWWGSNVTVQTGNITNGAIWCTISPGENALSGAVSSYNCPAFGTSAIHTAAKQITFVWCDGHAKAKTYVSSLNPTGATDDWSSSTQIMQNGNRGTQADRLLVSQNLYPDLK